MLEFLINDGGGLLIPALVLIVCIVSIIRKIKKRKPHQPAPDNIGLLGKIMGALVFRDLPRSIVGDSPTGHFQKPDFSYDDCEEEVSNDFYEFEKKQSDSEK